MTIHRTFRWPSLPTESNRGIVLGGDYSPDQWPEETLDEDIRLIGEAGMNVISLVIFSWDKIRPVEGVFTFEWSDHVIGRLGRTDIAVDLASATAAAPLWLYKPHPEALPVDRYGHTINAGSRQLWQSTNPVFKEYALRLCRKLAKHHKDNPYVAAWRMGNKYDWNSRYDYFDNTLAAFHTWYEVKYGTISALNEAWSAAFWSQHMNSFDEALLPHHMGGDVMANPSQQLDYERFGNDMSSDFYKAERDAIEQIYLDKSLTTNFMVSTDQCVMSYARWAGEMDFMSNDYYLHEGESHLGELACLDALTDSLVLGRPWCVMEHPILAVQWKPLNTRKWADELMRDPLAHMAMDANIICFSQWRQFKSGAGVFHSAMLPHTGADSKIFRGVYEFGKALETLSNTGLQDAEFERAGTTILFGAESEWATRSKTLPGMKLSHWRDVCNWYRGFLGAGLRVDAVPLVCDWAGYKTIVLPTVLSLSDGDVLHTADFAEAGRTVIVGYATGLTDEYFHIDLGGYPGAGNGLPRDMPGIRSEKFNILGEEAEDEPSEISLSNGLITRLWQNDVTSAAADTAVLASYAGESAADWELKRTPAIISRPYGNDTAIYVGYDFNRHDIAQLFKALGSRWQELSVQPTENGQTPAYLTTDPRTLHTIRRSADGSIRFGSYLNCSDQPVAINSVEGGPIVTHRCETDAVGYTLNRSVILIAKTPC